MSRLLARIMLALLMLPLAALMYGLFIVALMEITNARVSETTAFLAASGVAGAFVVAYWLLLWRHTVVWTRRRVALTAMSVGGAIVAGFAVFALASVIDTSFGVFIGGVGAILIWLLLSIFAWRETTDERMARIRGRGPKVLACPHCGYNMTGLGEAACPECGATFTIDELVAAQASTDAAQADEVQEDDRPPPPPQASSPARSVSRRSPQ